MSVGVDHMQRNFEPTKRQVEEWRARQSSATVAKLVIYQAFVEGELEAPKHLARKVQFQHNSAYRSHARPTAKSPEETGSIAFS